MCLHSSRLKQYVSDSDEKVQLGNDQKMAQSERKSHSKNKLKIGTYTKKKYRKPSEHLFPNRRPLNYPHLTKNMKTHIRCEQHKINTKT